MPSDVGRAELGTVPITCPVCGRHLDVPIYASGLMDEAQRVRFYVDAAFLEAHWLTHDQHDGEPVGQAA